MTETATEHRIKTVLTREAMVDKSPHELSNDMSLLDEAGLDSIQIVELITGLEEEFGISLEDDDMTLELFENVNSLAAFVRQALEAGKS